MANIMRCAEIAAVGQPLKITTRQIPPVPPSGALVQTTHAGLCHTDVHMLNDKLDLGSGKVMRYSDFTDKLPGSVLGHEIAGVILEFGKDIDPKTCGFKVGEKVAVFPWIGCQTCGPCKAGQNNMCDENRATTTDIGRTGHPGGFGTHVPVPDLRFLAKVPENVPMEVACMVPCSAATAYEGLIRIKDKVMFARLVRPDKPARLLIVGAGGLGLWGIRLARLVIPDVPLHITAADVDQSKLDLAREAGADKGVIWAREETPAEAAKHVTKDGLVDAALDFVGMSKTAETSIACLNKQACLILIGLGGGELKVSLPPTVSRGITIQGSRTMPVQTLTDLLNLIAKHNISYDAIQKVSLDDINEAIDKMKTGKLQGRAVICYEN